MQTDAKCSVLVGTLLKMTARNLREDGEERILWHLAGSFAKNDILSVYLPVTGSLRDPFVAPLHAENLKTLPPALVVAYEDNPMRDEGDEYPERLTRDGVVAKVSPYPNMVHGFF
jgi:acetyl esterase/lipase